MRPSRRRAGVRQTLIGLLAMPLSMVPLVAYGQLTDQGRLLTARASVAVAPPQLPDLSEAEALRYQANAPSWSGQVAVLVYHGLGQGNGEQRFTVTPEAFADQIAAMRAAGLKPVTATEVAEAASGGKPLPDNAVMLTFDDGRTDAFLWADPVLKDAGWPATMFVITDKAAERSLYYENWSTVADLAESGRWDIQSHTANLHHHQETAGDGALPALTSLHPDETLAQYRARVGADLDASMEAIAEHTGKRPVAFAYPFGAYGADRTNDARIRQVLAEELGERFAVAFQQDHQKHVPLAGCGQDPLLMRRLEVGGWSGAQLLDRLTQMAVDTPQGARCSTG